MTSISTGRTGNRCGIHAISIDRVQSTARVVRRVVGSPSKSTRTQDHEVWKMILAMNSIVPTMSEDEGERWARRII